MHVRAHTHHARTTDPGSDPPLTTLPAVSLSRASPLSVSLHVRVCISATAGPSTWGRKSGWEVADKGKKVRNKEKREKKNREKTNIPRSYYLRVVGRSDKRPRHRLRVSSRRTPPSHPTELPAHAVPLHALRARLHLSPSPPSVTVLVSSSSSSHRRCN